MSDKLIPILGIGYVFILIALAIVTHDWITFAKGIAGLIGGIIFGVVVFSAV